MKSFLRFWRRQKADSYEGAHARIAAEAALEQARAQRPAVDVVSRSLRSLNDENHFAEKVAALITHGR